MKKSLLITFIVTKSFLANAQLGMVGGIAGNIIARHPQAKLQKHFFVTAGMTYPLSLSDKLTGAKMVVPPLHITAEYGILNNITFGGMLGYYSALSPTIYSMSNGVGQTLDQLSGIFGQLGLNLSDLGVGTSFTDLFGNTNTVTGSYQYKLNYTLLGLVLRYNFVASRNVNMYAGTRVGYKSASKAASNNNNKGIDIISSTFDAANRAFYTGMLGANIFIDPKQKLAITTDAGLGYGLGDGISVGNTTVFFTLGLTYRKAPKSRLYQ